MTQQKNRWPAYFNRSIKGFIEQHCMHVSVDVEYDIYELLQEAYQMGRDDQADEERLGI